LQPSKNSPQPSPINDKPKIKTNDQLTPNPYTATNSGELPDGEETQYCWGATEILNSKKISCDPPEDEYLTAADDPDEVAIELSRSYRSRPSPD
jgi:hypothetical protein